MKQLKQLQRNGIGAHDLHNKVQFALPAELRSLVRSRSRVTCSSIGSCVLKVVSAKYRPIVSADISTDMAVDTRSILGRVSVEYRSSVDRHYRPILGRVSTECRSTIDRHIGRYSVDGISVNCRWHIGQLSVVYRCDVGGTGEKLHTEMVTLSLVVKRRKAQTKTKYYVFPETCSGPWEN